MVMYVWLKGDKEDYFFYTLTHTHTHTQHDNKQTKNYIHIILDQALGIMT